MPERGRAGFEILSSGLRLLRRHGLLAAAVWIVPFGYSPRADAAGACSVPAGTVTMGLHFRGPRLGSPGFHGSAQTPRSAPAVAPAQMCARCAQSTLANPMSIRSTTICVRSARTASARAQPGRWNTGSRHERGESAQCGLVLRSRRRGERDRYGRPSVSRRLRIVHDLLVCTAPCRHGCGQLGPRRRRFCGATRPRSVSHQRAIESSAAARRSLTSSPG